ncbi:MAG: hypothetical protein IJR57_08055 [Ruminococcus sp.]|nr:hypothetical protein [Ruminococcus sp.]
MKYCKTCKALYPEKDEYCPACKKKLAQIKDINEPVRLCVIGGTERALLTGLLTDAEIPFVEDNTYPQGLANEIVTGYDVKLSNISLLVPFSALPKASELLSSIETVENPVASYVNEINAQIERLKNGTPEEEEKNMSPALRTTIKVITALLFLILVAVVVLGTDKIMELIKGLFGG